MTPNPFSKIPTQMTEKDGPHPLLKEYADTQTLFEAQPAMVQRFLESQARLLAEAILRNQLEARFNLPDRVVVEIPSHGKATPTAVPAESREQMTGGIMDRLTRADMRTVLRQRLSELGGASKPSVVTSANLLRYCIAMHMVHDLLPAGRSVAYRAPEGEEIPTIPLIEEEPAAPAVTSATDAIVEEGPDERREELLVPYVPAARRFYLPQWVAFDDECHLLVNSLNQAEAHIASMQNFLSILHAAVSLAPYFICDDEYRRKRYGMLGQLINQGRALAKYEALEMIKTIRRRAEVNDLNRGLSLSLPYFDDQDLQMRTHDFEVIPAGRILFVPAFVVRAARNEMAKVAQDTRLSPSTRKYLLEELQIFEKEFDVPGKSL